MAERSVNTDMNTDLATGLPVDTSSHASYTFILDAHVFL